MSLYRHRGRELWWIFQLVDSAVERAINRIDSEIGAGHGHRVRVCMYVCMYYVCMYCIVCMYVCMYESLAGDSFLITLYIICM